MVANLLENFARWNLQMAALTIVAAGLVPLLRISAPVVRHAIWRGLLVVCLLLPLLQPWRSVDVDTRARTIDSATAQLVPGAETQTLSKGQPAWPARATAFARANGEAVVAILIGGGALLRLIWLALGIHRLRRLSRTGSAVAPTGEYEELTALIEAGADIRRVDRLGQPVTFGLITPAVLLPASFADMPPGVQRAVLAHELWHVRRRDWMWVVIEEGIRAAFWFNPVMWWLISRVQSSREEVVDELTVQLTNAKHTYLEALLAFADQPTLFPAAPFARRRHLFQRMLLISREAVMSSRRIIGSSIAMAAALLAAGVYTSTAIPLRAGVALAPGVDAQGQPRDRRPGEPGPETARERELKSAIAANPTNSDLYFQLAGMQVSRNATADADATMQALKVAVPGKTNIETTIAGFYARNGQFDRAISTLEDAAAANPSTPELQQMMAVFYWEKATKDSALQPVQRLRYIDAGIKATSVALDTRPDYVDALIYKNILLRMKVEIVADPAVRQTLIAEADVLRARAMEIKKTQNAQEMVFVPAQGQGAAPPPPPPGAFIDGEEPLVIGGVIKPPVKVRDVKPIYPAEAKMAGVEGVVIARVVLDRSGEVAQAWLLRGQPLLDEAALSAIRQWKFAPTLLNGVPKPVVMTVTVNFTLSGESK